MLEFEIFDSHDILKFDVVIIIALLSLIFDISSALIGNKKIYFLKRCCISCLHATVSQVTFISIALLTIQILSKQLHNIKIGKPCQ